MEDNIAYFYARAADGSRWRILKSDVLLDMETYEHEYDDKWPRPITDEMMRDWLGDNADSIEGWQFVENICPEPIMLDIEP